MRYVLVHGAWHGSWCWDRVTPLLASAGHNVEAVDLPGHGEPCWELGVGLVPYSPLGRGLLTGTIATTTELSNGDFRRVGQPRFSTW